MSQRMKENTFEQINDVQWQTIAAQSLRGVSLESLKTKAIEGLLIEPLYTKEMYDKQMTENEKLLLGNIQSERLSSKWVIAQQNYTDNGETFIKEAAAALKMGNEAICYDGRRPVHWSKKDLQQLADLILKYPVYAFYVNESDLFANIFDLIPSHDRKYVQGVVTGLNLPEGYQHVQTNVADLSPLHLEGADAVTELGAALAMIVQDLEDESDFDVYAKKLAIRFSIDTNFFMEIAKLRAFRNLWQTLTAAYGGTNIHVPVLAETSLRTYTKFDPHTNLLRAGNETLSAVLGGADVFTVHPHLILNKLSSASIRNARNLQLVIQEEASANAVLDPGYGSYYIDTLTIKLIKSAWSLFQEIEEFGGFQQYKHGGKLKKRIEVSRKKRFDALSRGEMSLVGTNIYADVNEKIESPVETYKVPGRIAEPFEAVRIKGLKHPVKTVLLRYGGLRDYKSRADFVKGFLAAGGIKPVESPVFLNVEALKDWLYVQDFAYHILCTSHDQAVMIMNQVPMLQTKWTDIAGKAPEDKMNYLTSLGVDGFIYKGQDMVSKLNEILDRGEIK